MGIMIFQVPDNLSTESVEALRRAYVAGGYDHSPAPTRVALSGNSLTLSRDNDESGCLTVPWEIDGIGMLMANSATLMERKTPYRFLVELARGKVNQIRSQASEWKYGGLDIPQEVENRIRAATVAFGQAVLETNSKDAEKHAQQALAQSFEAAELLIAVYIDQLFSFRRARQERINSSLACRLTETPIEQYAESFRRTFNSVSVPLSWRATEQSEASYNWEGADRIVQWAQVHQLKLSAGPLIDFSTHGLPDWLRTWEGDLPSLASFMCDFIETTITRYRNRIRRWVICTGSNCAGTLGLSEDDMIRLTARLAEAAWGIDSSLEVVVGLAQPWGDYLVGDNFSYSPFVFADTLLRAGLPLSGFELEWHMGTSPRGSYCRDPMEASRLLDMFAMLGCPLQVALSYPSAIDADPHSDRELEIGKSGHWHGLTPLAQAEWAEKYASLALSKGYVVGVTWDHFSDTLQHHFPNTGLIDAKGNKKPAFDRLQMLRETYLRDLPG